jgi:phage tail sheath gpL-like
MPKKIITAQRPFTMLIANVRAGADPAVANPVTMRSTFTRQLLPEIGGRGSDLEEMSNPTPGTHTRQGRVTFGGGGIPVATAGSITIAAAVTNQPVSWVKVGNYQWETGQDFVVANGDPTTTATNLATAMTNSGFTATPAGAVVNFTGPTGLDGKYLTFERGGYSPAMFTLLPSNGSLESGPAEPHIGPPVIGS